MRTRHPIAVLCLVACVGCVQHVVQHVDPNLLTNPDRLSEQGIFYALPRTVITVEIPITRAETEPSPFLRDLRAATRETREYLDATDPSYFSDEAKLVAVRTVVETPFRSPQVQEIQLRLNRLGITWSEHADTRFTLGEIRIETTTEPDPNQIYFVKVHGGLFSERALELELTETGILTAGKQEARDRTLDLAIEAVERAAEIGGISGLGKWAIMDLDKNPTVRTLRYATQVLDDLEALRSRRLQLIGGATSLPSLETLERMLAELDRMERSLVSYFRPSRQQTWHVRFEFRPEAPSSREFTRTHFAPSEMNHEIPLMEFSEGFGVRLTDAPGVRASSVPDEFRSDRRGPALTLSVVGGGRSHEPSVAEVIDRRSARLTRHGFPYRIPVAATATVNLVGKELARARLHVTQLGGLAFLPRSTGSLETRYDVSFHPDTGSLKDVSIHSVGIEPSSLERLGRTAQQLLEAQDDIRERISELENDDDLREKLDIQKLDEIFK